eukprot:8725160-Karenia_brevis.AAC.1
MFAKIHCLQPLIILLFSVMLRAAVYPVAWGRALIISFLKPGKDAENMNGYRGIRLVSRFAA